MDTPSRNTFENIAFLSGPLVFITLFILLPENFIAPGAYKVIAVAAWMIIWWVTESAPIPITALLPLVLFPFAGIMKMNEAAAPYANPIIFLFMGGFLLALALEKHKLHERIALNLIRLTGTSGNGIILGFMIATAVISMWISNTATAMMMMPIASSVINLVRKDPEQPAHELPKPERNFALGLMLMVGYSATLGGLATIIGTPPNVVFVGLLEKFYGRSFDFGRWMLVGVPVAAALCGSTYLIVTKILFRNGIKKIEGSDDLIKTRLVTLGRMRREEVIVVIIFSITSFLWIFQEAINAYMLKQDLLTDTNIAMMGGLLMFLVPVNLKERQFLLTWKDTKNMQWGILLLFGGGLCLASGLEKVGIIQALGTWIAAQSSFNLWLVLLLIAITVILSEFMSNVALVQIFIPVVFGIADGLQIDPILLAMPVTLAASIGFMFPIATPPNAIVFATGYIRMKDMMRAGILLDIASMIIILLASITILRLVI
jgi:solute carrier family 13 (sodium-dependent dicarboxylate transporter), member 2/3/5